MENCKKTTLQVHISTVLLV